MTVVSRKHSRIQLQFILNVDFLSLSKNYLYYALLIGINPFILIINKVI